MRAYCVDAAVNESLQHLMDTAAAATNCMIVEQSHSSANP